MKSEMKKNVNEPEMTELGQERRELVRKMGKFAVYAAPFTLIAMTNKASAATGATGSGPRKHR